MKYIIDNSLLEITNKDVVLCVGQTGCGKSTLLTSLVYGTDALRYEKYDH